MALINCPECGKEVSDKAESCPNCGFIINRQREVNNFIPNGNQLKCPKCGGLNVTFQREQTGSIGAGTNKVVIHQAKKSKGCVYWCLIGWWLEPCYWICFGLWKNLLFGGKSKSGINIHGEKSINRTMAICQNCGYSWKM